MAAQIDFPLLLLTFLPSYLFSGEVLSGPGGRGEVERNTYNPGTPSVPAHRVRQLLDLKSQDFN